MESIWLIPSNHEGGERLEMAFSHYQVAAYGKNLAGLLDDLHQTKVRLLRNLPL